MEMENLQKIAMLIDADNTQLSKMDSIMREISTYGRIVVKRAYGNWKKDVLKNWEEEIKRLAIKPVQQFDYVTGKNATDIAMVIDAMDLLHMELYDAFVIVASDSDYTPIAIKLHESGIYVIGVGEKMTPESFRNSCDEFIYLENLTSETGVKQKKYKFVYDEQDYGNSDDDSIDEIHSLLKIAFEKYQDDDGYVNVSSAGTFIKRTKPDFDLRSYGYFKLPDMIEAYPDMYKIKRYKGKGTVTIVAYKCLQ